MKKDWTYKKLGEVCEILNGFAFKSDEYEENGVRVMRITNVQKGTVVDDDPKFFPLARVNEISRYLLREGDVLISLTGNVGRVGIMEEKFLPAALNQRVACLRLKDKEVDKKYLFHILNSDAFENDCIFNAAGIAQKNMSTKWLEQYDIPVPPLETQQHIVSELDLLQSIIDKQKAQLKELDNLAQAVFYDMFGDPVENEKGWDVKKLGTFCSKIGSGATPRGGNESYKTEGISLIRSLNVHNNEFVYKDLAFIDEEQARALSNVDVQPNDILLNITGASVARCCVVPDYLLPARVNQHVCIIRPINDVEVHFLSRLLTNAQYQAFLIDLARGKAATREALPKNIVEGLPIIIPPLSLQHSFAAKIESIEKQKAAINKSIEESQKLFDYTMDKYFG